MNSYTLGTCGTLAGLMLTHLLGNWSGLSKGKRVALALGTVSACAIPFGIEALKNSHKKQQIHVKADEQIRVNDAKAEKEKELDTVKTDNDIRKGHEATEDSVKLDTMKTRNDIEQHHEKTKDEIALMEAKCNLERVKTDGKIRQFKAKTKAVQKRDATRKRNERQKPEDLTYNPTHDFAKRTGDLTFDLWFQIKFGYHPETPQLLDNILSQCHTDYWFPALFTSLSVLGTYCFSNLRVQYNGLHTPTFFVIIEGPSGSGKSFFKRLFETLAAPFIGHDRRYFVSDNETTPKRIIQTIPTNISRAKYIQRRNANGDVFGFTFFSEIDEAEEFQKKLGNTFFRHAYDNDTISYDNMVADQYGGCYKIYHNFVLTGTLRRKKHRGWRCGEVCFLRHSACFV